MKKNKLFCILNILLFLICLSCGKTTDESIENKIIQEFYTVMPTQKYTLNPQQYRDEYSRALIVQLWEGITELKTDGVRLVSADSIEHSDDFKTWKIKLRKDLKWSDNISINAKTFLDSWISALKNKNSSEEIYKLFVIKNAKNIFQNKIPENKLGVTAENDILTIKLESPVKNFDEWLASPIFYPIREENKTLNPENLIVNGAFKIDNSSSERITLSKNNKYWDSDNTLLKKVFIELIPDNIMAYEMFPRMEIDFFGAPFYRVPFERRKQLTSLPESVTFRINRYLYVEISDKNQFLASKKIRKLLYSSTDPNFMGKVIILNNSPSIFEHPELNSTFLNSLKEKFFKEKENYKNIDANNEFFTAYSEAGKTFEKKILLSTAKEWISLFRMPIRVTSSEEIIPDFKISSYLIGTNNIEDFYYFINSKYQNANSKLLIKNKDDFLKTLPILPLNKVYDSVLVQAHVKGLYIEPSGDLHLKYVHIKYQ